MSRICSWCVVALIAWGAEAWAEESWGQSVLSFEQLDRDGDGFLSPDEAAYFPGLLEYFSVFDRNGDGLLSRSELAVLEGRRIAHSGGAI